MDSAKLKHRPTYADLNPNTRFVDNPIVHLLRNNEALSSYLYKNKLNWVNHTDIIKTLHQLMLESEEYNEYIMLPEADFEVHRRFLVKFFNKEVMNCEELYDTLEDMNIFWNDDVDFVLSMIAKTIKKMTPEDLPSKPLMPLYRDQEDRDFVYLLLRKSLLNSTNIDDLIVNQAKNWDLERIIFMDKILLRLAITEILEMSTIPIKVTINEYLEISKLYSSQKSNVFINGVLDKLVLKLKKEEKVNKQGRGLIGEM